MMPPTNREIEVLLASARLGEQEAAKQLGISQQTVKNTLTTLYRKLGARGVGHAILILMENHRI
jgi:DNA-binding CsgD family transcriptional regulator